jgi:hypothetical protein
MVHKQQVAWVLNIVCDQSKSGRWCGGAGEVGEEEDKAYVVKG